MTAWVDAVRSVVDSEMLLSIVARFIFLMRHAEHEHGTLTSVGAAEVAQVAERFSEWLQVRSTAIDWYFSSASEVRQTASVFLRRLAAGFGADANPEPFRVAKSPADAADGGAFPNGLVDNQIDFGAYEPDPTAILNLLHALKESSNEAVSPLLVGNDPLISWLASKLCKEDFAVSRGELVCFEATSRGQWRPAWTVDPNGEKTYDAIVSKIESKMNSAKVLGAVITALLVFLIQNVIRDRPVWLEWTSLGALATSAGMYFAALFLYDGLLMPPRYWASAIPARRSPRWSTRAMKRIKEGRPGLERPPSSSARVLQQAMLRIWNRMFVPATLTLGLGIALLIIAAPLHDRTAFVPDSRAYAGAAVWVLFIVGWVAANRPKLGVSD
jgi:phosphohistidine phosphatase SixA